MKMRNQPSYSLFLLTLLFLAGALPPALAQAPARTYSDGPYLFWENDRWVARWMADNKLHTAPVEPGQPLDIDTAIAPTFAAQYLRLDRPFVPETQTEFKHVGKIAAISDTHGQYELARQLLQANGIIDEQGRWAYGNGHLVVNGDILDRGDKMTELLWLFHNLEPQAAAAGGRVHVLLGNHEAMVMEGDLRYLHPKYRYTSATLGLPYDSIMGPQSYLGRWLRSKPLTIAINDIAFVHAGFSPLLLQVTQSLDEINRAYREKILDADAKLDQVLQDTFLNVLYYDHGPLWYRGYFAGEGVAKEDLRKILHAVGYRHLVVGHTPHDSVTTFHNNRLIVIDSNIQTGKKGEILLWEHGHFYRADREGVRQRLE